MTFLILGLPFAAALVCLVFRHVRAVAALLAVGAAFVLGALVLQSGEAPPLVILGRSLALDAAARNYWPTLMGILAFTFIGTAFLPEKSLLWPLAWGCVGFLQIFLSLESLSLAVLSLQAGLILMVMAMSPEESENPSGPMQVLAVLVLGGVLMLIGSVLLEPTAASLGESAITGALALAGGLAIILGAFPFFVWQITVFRTSSAFTRILLGTVFVSVVLLRFEALRGTALSSLEDVLPSLLLNAGIATFVVGCVGAWVQDTLKGVLGYTAVAEMGIILMALSSDAPMGYTLAMTHLLYRNIALVGVSLGISALEQSLGKDDFIALRGALGRAPLASVGVLLAGLSLGGFPPLAGFVTRFAFFQMVAAQNLSWGLALAALGFGPAWAFLRFAVAAFQAVPVPGGRQEPRGIGVVILLVGILSLALGLCPQMLRFLPLVENVLGSS